MSARVGGCVSLIGVVDLFSHVCMSVHVFGVLMWMHLTLPTSHCLLPRPTPTPPISALLQQTKIEFQMTFVGLL